MNLKYRQQVTAQKMQMIIKQTEREVKTICLETAAAVLHRNQQNQV